MIKFTGKGRANVFEYFCSISSKLDEILNLNLEERPYYRHYIYLDASCVLNKCLPIRIPGETIGCINLDNNNKITGIKINKYYTSNYPNINVLDNFLGEEVSFDGLNIKK